MINKICVICLLVLVGCAGPKSSDAPVTTKPGAIASAGYILSGGVKVGYVLNITDGFATTYIPAVDKYVNVNPATGLYDTRFYGLYAGLNCTGEVRLSSLSGEPGKTVVYDGSTYYLATSVAFSSFITQSAGLPGSCTNFSTTYTRTFTLVVTSRPFDFSTIAPLVIQYQ